MSTLEERLQKMSAGETMENRLNRMRAGTQHAVSLPVSQSKTAAQIIAQNRIAAQKTGAPVLGESVSGRARENRRRGRGNELRAVLPAATTRLPVSGKVPTLAERVASTVSGAAKNWGSSMANTAGTAFQAVSGGKLKDMEQEQRDIQRTMALMEEGHRAGGFTPDEEQTYRQELARQREKLRILGETMRATAGTGGAAQTLADDLSASGAADTERAKQGLGGLGRFAVDTGSGALQMGGDIAAGILTGGGALPAMFARSFGGGAQEARQAGATQNQQLLYGLGSGALSVATEKIANVAAPFKKAFGGGVLDAAIGKAAGKLGQSAAGKLALSMLSEGGEEFIEDVFQPVLKRAVYDKSASFDLGGALYDAAVGAALGGIGGGVEVLQGKGAADGSEARPIETQEKTASRTKTETAVKADTSFSQVESIEIEPSARISVPGNPAEQPVNAIDDSINSIAASGMKINAENGRVTQLLIDALAGKKRVEQGALTDAEFERAADNGLHIDAGGKVYRPLPTDHIDRRTVEGVGKKNVNAFQFDHPELQNYYKKAAESLLADADISTQFPMPRRTERTVNGKRTIQHAIDSVSLRSAMDMGLSRNQIMDAAQALIHDHGQENYAAAKRLEIVLDEMLTNGYTTVFGQSVEPNGAYVSAKSEIVGSAPAQHVSTIPDELDAVPGDTPGDAPAVNENGLNALSEREQINLSSGKKNKIISTFSDTVNFVRNALQNKQSSDRAYLGKVPDTVTRKVLTKTGVDITGFGVMMNGNDIRHIVKDHGDPLVESARGQITVMPEDIARIPEILSNPDTVSMSGELDGKGRKAIVFERQIGNRFITVQGISDGKNVLQTDTLYIQKGRTRTTRDTMLSTKSAAPVINAQGVPPQSSSINSIPASAENVKSDIILDLVSGRKRVENGKLVDAADGGTAAGGTDNTKRPYDPIVAGVIRREGKTFRNLVAGWDTSVSAFFNKWKNGRVVQNGEKLEKLYLGRLTDSVRQQVSDILGYAMDNRDVIVTNDDIKHIFDHHGDAAAEIQRGNLPIEAWVLDALPEIVAEPDTISPGEVTMSGKHPGKQSVLFSRTFQNGQVVIVQFDNAGRGTMEITTMYVKENSGNPTRALNVGKIPPQLTSKTPPGPVVSAKNSILQSGENVNDSLGGARGGFDPFPAAQMERGTLPSGENPVRPDDVPASITGFDRVSQSVVTAKGTAVTPDAFVPLLENETMKGRFSFIPITNSDTVQTAMDRIRYSGWEAARADWTADVRAGKAGDEVTAIGALLYNNAVNSGDERAALDILTDYQAGVRNTARGLQAARILKTLTPSSRLYMIRKSVQNMVDDLRLPGLQIDSDLEEKYLSAKTDAEADAVLSEIQQNIADQVPSTLLDKWTALRYVNMLGNFKTQVRNLSGNTAMRGVVRVKDAIATGLERLSGTERTKSLTVGKDLLNAAKEDFAAVRAEAAGESKYTHSDADGNDFRQGVMDKRRIFSTHELEAYRKATDWAMNNGYFGDVAFLRRGYARSLAGYLKANGVTAEQFTDADWQTAHTELLDKARAYSIREAQEATFRDSNTISDWVSKIGRRKNTPRPVRIASEGLAPFRKTPANVLVRAEEYSPLGILNTAYLAAERAAANTSAAEKRGTIGNFARAGRDVSGSDIVNSMAKTLTGTGVFLVGMLLRNAGFVRGDDDDDKKQAAFDDLTGHQTYSLELPNGKSVTLDWLSPISMPFFMGVQLMDQIHDGGFALKDLESSLTSIADPMLQMSMMQGVNDVFDDLKYSEDNLGQLAASLAVSYLTQGLTNSILGQLERTTEETRKSTYVDKENPVPDWLQRELGKMSAKTPIWEYQQIPYIDAWGREEDQGNLALRTFNNVLNPAYVSDVKVRPIEQELQRLADETGETGVFPRRADKTFTVDGKEKALSSSEYVKYAKALGKEKYALLETAVNAKWYKAMSDGEKADYIGDLYEYANAQAKQAVAPGAVFDGWIGSAETARQDIGVSTAEYIALHERYGSALVGESYEKVKSAVRSGVSVDDYMDIRGSMDGNGNGSISQTEAQAALDASDLSQQQKDTIWQEINKSWKKNPYR